MGLSLKQVWYSESLRLSVFECALWRVRSTFPADHWHAQCHHIKTLVCMFSALITYFLASTAFSGEEKTNIAWYIGGIMFYKLGLEFFNGE